VDIFPFKKNDSPSTKINLIIRNILSASKIGTGLAGGFFVFNVCSLLRMGKSVWTKVSKTVSVLVGKWPKTGERNGSYVS
jgi:hypothetical protein